MTRKAKVWIGVGVTVLVLWGIGAASNDNAKSSFPDTPAAVVDTPVASGGGGGGAIPSDSLALIDEATQLSQEVTQLAVDNMPQTQADVDYVCANIVPQLQTKTARIGEIVDELGPLADVDAGSGTMRNSYADITAALDSVTANC